jgi:hypothetical protein
MSGEAVTGWLTQPCVLRAALSLACCLRSEWTRAPWSDLHWPQDTTSTQNSDARLGMVLQTDHLRGQEPMILYSIVI